MFFKKLSAIYVAVMGGELQMDSKTWFKSSRAWSQTMESTDQGYYDPADEIAFEIADP
jgi:hypothetical protein